MTRPTPADLLAHASAATLALNPGLGATAASQPVRGETPVESPAKGLVRDAPYGRCPHTGRAYRSKTEARWAAEHPEHRYEAVAITTPCGAYWPDFVVPMTDDTWIDPLTDHGQMLIEVKGGWIRDRAMHKVKAAIRPALALGFAGIWLAQWKGGRWTVEEVREG